MNQPVTIPRLRPVAVLAVIAGLAAGVTGCGGKQGGGHAGGGGFSMPPMPVETAVVEAGPLVDRFTVVGSLEASDAITVVSEIDAAVEALPFHEGQAIAQGGLIAQLDDAQLRAQYDRALALRDQQQSTFARIKTVVDQGAGAPQDLDDAAAALKVAEADLELAQTRLAKTRITAPFGGIAGIRRVSQGAYLTSGDAITDLVRIDELRVNFTAPERLLGQLHRGAPVQVTTSAYPDQTLTGTIDIIDPQVDPDTRGARIVARLPNADLRLRPGMSATVDVTLARVDRALTVPAEAVILQGGKTLVYVVKPDSTVAPQPVVLGLREPAAVEVVQGLSAGDRVVTAGHQKIFPGARVLPVSGATAPPPPAHSAPDSSHARGGGA